MTKTEANVIHQLADRIDRLLEAPDLNLDELEDKTREAVSRARIARSMYAPQIHAARRVLGLEPGE